MQEDIRNADEKSFPALSNFIDYYTNGDLTNPVDVAEKLLPYCLGNPGENGSRLDVRNLWVVARFNGNGHKPEP